MSEKTSLYLVPRNTYIRPEGGPDLLFMHVDGMYSLCYTDSKSPVHLAAWTEVEILGPPGGGTYSKHITTSTNDKAEEAVATRAGDRMYRMPT